MTFSDIIILLGGVAMFLYGMKLMGNSLEQFAGSKLKSILGSLTSNPYKGFGLGLAVTAAIQSSAATIVMVVGFVNSGLMTLYQAGGVIFGANLGTSVTGWIISASGLTKSDAIYYGLLFIGVLMFWFIKKQRIKHFGLIIVGFSILMIGMQTMSGAVSGLKDSDVFEKFSSTLTNPILGLLFGIIFTVLIQSSSASVGVLQTFATATALPFSLCIPFMMGANIGTTSTALISSLGATKDAKRAALFDFVYNVLSVAILLPLYVVINAIFDIPFFTQDATAFTIAITHTSVKVLQILLMFPLLKVIVKITKLIVPDEKNTDDKFELLDERLLVTPSVALERAKVVTQVHAQLAIDTFKDAAYGLASYSDKIFETVKKNEDKTDLYEDKIGSYLVKLSAHQVSADENLEASQLLKLIGDYERIADHAMNIIGSASEMHDKKVDFTESADRELGMMVGAVLEILDLSYKAYFNNDIESARLTEPLEEVIDELKLKIRNKHIERLQKGECTIEMGFVLSDLLTDLERVADHCSNVSCYVMEAGKRDLESHAYVSNLEKDKGFFSEHFNDFKEKYNID